MPVCTKLCFGQRDIVLDRDPTPHPKRGTAATHFSAHVLWPNAWMGQDATSHEGRSRPRPHCVRCKTGYSGPQFLGHRLGDDLVDWNSGVSVRTSVRPYVRPSVRPSVRPQKVFPISI